MNITKTNILGVGSDTSLVNIGWERPHTPNTKDAKKKVIDSVEMEIDHKGIFKLEQLISKDTQYFMCFVHFDANTENLDGIYMEIWDENSVENFVSVEATKMLCEEEKKVIVDYALTELRQEREWLKER